MEKLSYKHKYYLLLAALALLVVVMYVFAVKKTIAVIAEHNDLSGKIELAASAPQQIVAAEAQLKQMEQLVVNENPLDFEQVLLEQVSGFCQKNGLILIEFPKTTVSGYRDYQIYTNRIVLEGGFKKMVEFIYEAEQKYNIGKIVSVQFKRTKDMRSKRLYLYAYIYFQNIQITQTTQK
ncbi:MAG: hypothetical protein LBR52_03785 [Prevotellaceae bacterium]|nr:hypothetical protein [Prevotellaceae bacterium]